MSTTASISMIVLLVILIVVVVGAMVYMYTSPKSFLEDHHPGREKD